jgi:hypothetical protein
VNALNCVAIHVHDLPSDAGISDPLTRESRQAQGGRGPATHARCWHSVRIGHAIHRQTIVLCSTMLLLCFGTVCFGIYHSAVVSGSLLLRTVTDWPCARDAHPPSQELRGHRVFSPSTADTLNRRCFLPGHADYRPCEERPPIRQMCCPSSPNRNRNYVRPIHEGVVPNWCPGGAPEAPNPAAAPKSEPF